MKHNVGYASRVEVHFDRRKQGTAAALALS